jgi:hypothetical protein
MELPSPLDPEDEPLRALCAPNLMPPVLAKFFQRLCIIYERTEHELAWGLVLDPQTRAEHEHIRAKVQSGSSLADAMTHWVFDQYAKKYEREHPLG